MGLLSVTEYAKKTNKDPGNIRRMLLCKRLNGFKIGNQWVIEEGTNYPVDNRIKSGKYKVYSQEELFTIIKSILNKYQIDSASLFGSYARNEATSSSDIDLLVNGNRNFERTDIFSIAEELHELSGKNVDVYEINEISKNTKLYKNIKNEAIKII